MAKYLHQDKETIFRNKFSLAIVNKILGFGGIFEQ
jgi:hypothetical protein